jgi:hypothetical protein
MIVLALVLLIIVLVFSVAIVLSNPNVYQLSLFRVLVPVTSAGVFFTGFGAALATIIAVLLLRTGIRRGRATRRRLRTAPPPATSRAGATPGSGAASAEDAHSGRPTDRPLDRSTDQAVRRTGSTSDLVPGEDPTTVPVDHRAERRDVADRDEPRI